MNQEKKSVFLTKSSTIYYVVHCTGTGKILDGQTKIETAKQFSHLHVDDVRSQIFRSSKILAKVDSNTRDN